MQYLKFSLQTAFLFFSLSVSQPSWAQPPGTGWRLHFCDEFSGDQVDSLKWLSRYPWGRTHNHDAYMLDDNVQIANGFCTLFAKRETVNGKPFSSGVISTGYSKYTAKHGYIEARILLPNRPGSWPAFWGLYDGWPPENDIMEYPIDTAAGNGYAPTEYHTAFHYSTGGGNAAGGGQVNPGGVGDLGNSWHTFGMEWIEDDLVRWYFDGQVVRTFGNQSAIAQMERMYLILNYAVGGWPGRPNQSEWPDLASDTTVIDWVRVWQKPDQTGAAVYAYNQSPVGSWTGDENWNLFEPRHSRQIARFESLAQRDQMQVGWNKLKTIGEVYIDGDTSYTLGDADGNLDSLMFADEGDGWSRLWVEGGTGTHQILSRIEIRNRLSLMNLGAQPLTLSGDVHGHYRETGPTATARIYFKGAGTVVFNGDGYYQNSTDVTEGSRVEIRGRLYQGRVADSASVRVDLGSTLSLDSLSAGESLGALPEDTEKLLLNSGTIELRGDSVTSRGLTVGAGGGALVTANGTNTLFSGNTHEFDLSAGGSLSLAGDGFGSVKNLITGAGNLAKTGAGTWRIDGANNYSGHTSVDQGILHINGFTGAGATHVAVDGTIQGNGVVRGTLVNDGKVAPTGDVADGTLGQFIKLDNFEDGDVEGWDNSDGNPLFTNVVDPSNPDNRVAAFRGGTGGDDVAFLNLGLQSISEDTAEATVYFRVAADSSLTGDGFEVSLGLGSDFDSTPDSQFDYAVQTIMRDELAAGQANSKYLFYNNGASFFASANDFWSSLSWMDVWYVVDNIAKTYDLYVDVGQGPILVVDDFSFRTMGSSIDSIFLTSGAAFDVLERLYIDDIYVDQSNRNLNRPNSAVNNDFDPVGTLTVNGSFSQSSTGTLSMDIAGADALDRLVVASDVHLAGTLTLNFLDGFEPVDGQTFQLVSSLANLQGTFEQVVDNLDSAQFVAELVYLPNSVLVVYQVQSVVLGDVNLDGNVNLLDVGPFVTLVANGQFQPEADINQDGIVNLLDVNEFVERLVGG